MTTNKPEGLRIFSNPSLRYASHPRLVDTIRDKLKVVIEGESKRVIYTDPIFKGSPFTLNQWFSTVLTDGEVLANWAVESELRERFGYRLLSYWTLAI